MKSSLQDIVFVALLVFAAALFGIVTRPIGFLSAFWPANALLLGVMLRHNELSTPYTWLAAFAGFIAADMLTGSEWGVTLWLTAANIAGALAGWLVLRRVPAAHLQLSRPSSIFYLLGGGLAAATAASVTGCWVAPELLGTDLLRGFFFWLSSELVNYIIILPVVLTAPGLAAIWQRLRASLRWRQMLPALSLGASIIAGSMVGGPGSLAIPVPALLWCALSYSLFTTSILTVIVGGWLMIAFTDGFVALTTGDDRIGGTVSVRLGVAMLALAPLAVASMNSARNELLSKLNFAANHDHLTGVLTRGAMVAAATKLLEGERRNSRGVALLMLDLDHFKQINDRHGHPIGDEVLIAFARVARAELRGGDLLGRFGGEEFVALLPDTDRADAIKTAERLRLAVTQITVPCGGEGAEIGVSVSIGLATAQLPAGLDGLLSLADQALYRAKEGGRNRVEISTAPEAAAAKPGKFGLAA